MLNKLEEIINVDEVQILINKFETCRISFPIFSKFQLFESDFKNDGYNVKMNSLNFGENIRKLEDFLTELPNYEDFKECFLASGYISYKNINEFEKKLKTYKNIRRKVYFAPDTNILYHCFISCSSLKDDRILIAPTVKEEILNSMNFKFKKNQILEFKSKISFQKNFLDELINRRKKRTRKAIYLAQNELQKINCLNVEEIDYEPEVYGQRDLKIIKELKNFEKDSGALVVLLTADRLMKDLCETENIDYFLFNLPDTINPVNGTAKMFCRLIYNLAAVFGFIQLNSVIIFGEFKEKNNSEDLKIKFLNENIFKEFQRDLKISRRLLELNIDF
ncbi:MAG: PIN domain-containing protein [Candidatus Helarchaeota archaeon]